MNPDSIAKKWLIAGSLAIGASLGYLCGSQATESAAQGAYNSGLTDGQTRMRQIEASHERFYESQRQWRQRQMEDQLLDIQSRLR